MADVKISALPALSQASITPATAVIVINQGGITYRTTLSGAVIAAYQASGVGSGTVTSVSVASANGFAGTVATSTTTPAITLTTTITGLLKGNATAISAAVAGTDYTTPTGSESLSNKTIAAPVFSGTATGTYTLGGTPTITSPVINSPALNNTNLTGLKLPVYNSQPTSTGVTGAVTVDWSASAVYKQNEPTGNITYTFTAPGVSNCHLQLYIDSDGTSASSTITWPASVIWYGTAFTATTANKKAMVNFWYDGTSYHAMGVSQV